MSQLSPATINRTDFVPPQGYFKYFVGRVHIKVSSVDALVWSDLCLNLACPIPKVTLGREEWLRSLRPHESSLTNKGQRAGFCHFCLWRSENISHWAPAALLRPHSIHWAIQDHFHLCKGNEAEESVYADVRSSNINSLLLMSFLWNQNNTQKGIPITAAFTKYCPTRQEFCPQLKTFLATDWSTFPTPVLVCHFPLTIWRVRRKQSKAMNAASLCYHGNCCQQTCLRVASWFKGVYCNYMCGEGPPSLWSKVISSGWSGCTVGDRRAKRGGTKGTGQKQGQL